MEPNTQVIYVNKSVTGVKLFFTFVLTIIISLAIGGGVVYGLFKYYPDVFGETVTNITKMEKEVTVTDKGIADAVDKTIDSVVIVKTYSLNRVVATGTGFIYKYENNKYYMITNYHVIQNGDRVKVTFTDGNEESVIIEGGDKYSDIAVLSFETTNSLAVAEIGSSVEMRVGDTVFAIGAPLDSSVYSWSVTRGILSGKDREIEVSTENNSTADWIMQVLQTDAAINNGNSGGPLCNSNGQVIGITNMKLITNGVEGMGFAIPVEEAVLFANSIVAGGNISRPYLGIKMIDATNEYYAREYNVQTREGVLLGGVERNTSADRAGLRIGDVIVAINDTKVKNIASLRYELYKYKIGDVVKVKFYRNGNLTTTSLTLSS